MKNKIVMKLSDGRELIAEVDNYDGEHEELAVYINSDNLFQDICLIREDENTKNNIECLVWSDKDEEDYTDRFSIEPYRRLKERDKDEKNR